MQFDFLHARDEGRKAAVTVGRGHGAGDVGGVTPHLGARIDEQDGAVPLLALALVVEGGALLVQGHDAPVGHLVIHDAGGLDVGVVDFQLAGSGHEGGPGGLMRPAAMTVASSMHCTS